MRSINPFVQEGGDTVFKDVLLLALFGFAVIALLLLPHINPRAIAAQEGMPPPGHVIVELRWPDDMDADVDLWVQAPGDVPVGCPSSKQMGLLSVFHKGGSGSSLFDVKPLGFDGSSGGFGWSVFDLFSLFDDGGVASKVGVGWSYVADALVVALVVVVIDEGADLVFEIAG